MVFSSPFFLSVFLPLLLIVYFLSKIEYRNIILLFASLIFYSWGEPKACLVMLMLILINYYAAIFINRTSYVSRKKIILFLAIFINIGVLFIYKYLDFALSNINILYY